MMARRWARHKSRGQTPCQHCWADSWLKARPPPFVNLPRFPPVGYSEPGNLLSSYGGPPMRISLIRPSLAALLLVALVQPGISGDTPSAPDEENVDAQVARLIEQLGASDD